MSFIAELKRRNVIRVGIAYLVVAWLVLQFADVVLGNIEAPPWVFQAIMLVLAIGLPIVLVFAWAFEMTPEGLKLEKDVDRSQSITPQTGKKLNNVILVLMALAIGYLLYDKFSDKGPEPIDRDTRVQISEPGNEKGNPATESAQADNSIAVLPFANRSDEKEDLYFTDGIHDDLLTQLANIKGLKVISRTSVMAYRDTTKQIPEIASELGVSKILEGGVQRAGKRIRINAQLIDVATDEHLWAETFDREMTIENIFDIQSEITRHIVTAVRGELTAEETGALTLRPTDNLDAYEAYLQARAFLNDPVYSSEKFINAEAPLKKAVVYDPGFAQAWALLVSIHGQAIWTGYDETPERHQAALDALQNAEIYGPALPETIAAKAEYMYRVKADFHAAEPLFAQASQAKPSDSDLLIRLATTERRTGHFEQAITHFQMAIDLDPTNLEARTVMLDTLVFMRAWDRAELLTDLWIEKYPETSTFKTAKVDILVSRHGDIEAAKALLAEVEPNSGPRYVDVVTKLYMFDRNFPGLLDIVNRPPMSAFFDNDFMQSWSLQLQADAYRYMGDTGKAAEFYTAAIETGTVYQSTSANNMAWNLDSLAKAYAGTGQYEKAMAAIDRSTALVPESADAIDGTWFMQTRARILGMAGRHEEALAEIERLLNTPVGLNRWDLYLSPDWDFFRDDARFNQLARPLNLEETGQ